MTITTTVTDYISDAELKYLSAFSKDKNTPFLLLNVNKVHLRYEELRKNLPFAKIYYAVKANPDKEVILILKKLGSNFDVASVYELDFLLNLNIHPDQMSYGNTIKKESDIEYAYKQGIRLFATDSLNDVDKIAKNAPGSKVFFRIIHECKHADWPLSKKFGAYQDLVKELILRAQSKGLVPYGISFHVGSQQRDTTQWNVALRQCKAIFDFASENGITLKMINLGGGFPSNYLIKTPPLEEYCDHIKSSLNHFFEDNLPEIFIEPGRSIVADSGIIVSEIVQISRKSTHDTDKWVYLDVGKFGGLIETLDESIKYPIFVEGRNYSSRLKLKKVILAGPTCDSMDILYKKFQYKLPDNINEGEKVFILTTGAYTFSYSSICFNGIPPMKVYVINKEFN